MPAGSAISPGAPANVDHRRVVVALDLRIAAEDIGDGEKISYHFKVMRV